ncbi:unnamed protein product, partial [Ilex paraguariensis]
IHVFMDVEVGSQVGHPPPPNAVVGENDCGETVPKVNEGHTKIEVENFEGDIDDVIQKDANQMQGI